MSDQIMGGGVATEEPPVEAPDPVTGSRRNLIVVGVAVAAAVAVAVWFLFLSGGGSATPTGAVPASTAKPNGAGNGATPKASTSAKPVKSATSTDKGRNPFTPLLTEPTAQPSPTAPVAAPSPSASTAAASPSASTSASVPAAGNVVATVSLVKVDSKAKTATFNVDASGTTNKFSGVGVGDTFATFFKLYDLGSKCAQLQYGDQTGAACVGTPLVLYSAS
jgi:hypothetical protein